MAHLRFWLSPSPQLVLLLLLFYFTLLFYSSVSLFACNVVE